MDEAARVRRLRRWAWAAGGFAALFAVVAAVRLTTGRDRDRRERAERVAAAARQVEEERIRERLREIEDGAPRMPPLLKEQSRFGTDGDGTHEPVPPPTFPRGVQGVVASTDAKTGRVVVDRGACRTAPVESVVIGTGASGLRARVVEATDRWVTVELESLSGVEDVSAGDFVLFDPPR